jgi:Zn-dependent M16 (insulinase) family peptidase
MTEDIYRHRNDLKHINLINSDGFSALFVVNTPVFDNSGVAHGVEHMVFRRSSAFSKSESLFQLTSLTDAKINASTFAETTYFHCQSQCYHTFVLAINYLLNGLFNPIFDDEDLRCEIHDGVIYQELIGIELAYIEEARSTQSPQSPNQNDFFYGGTSTSIGDLSLNDLRAFHQRFYQANNITLVTANADIEHTAKLIALLPKRPKQSKQIRAALGKYRKKLPVNTKKMRKTMNIIKKIFSGNQQTYYCLSFVVARSLLSRN